MENKVQIFSNAELGQLRTVGVNGEIWFVGKDAAEILKYARPADAIAAHVDSEDKGVAKMPTPGGVQEMVIINESGLYSLILSSKLETAKKFQTLDNVRSFTSDTQIWQLFHSAATFER